MRINKRANDFKTPARIPGIWIAGIAVLAFLVLSCPTETEDDPDGETVLATRSFWAQNLNTQKYYQTQADLLVEGRYCKIWVEQGSGAPALDVAGKIAGIYDNDIYIKMIETFSLNKRYVDEKGNTVATNTMELADWLADGDGKLNILLLDIQDGYVSSENGGYVGGYFWSGNFYRKESANPLQYSNEIDMIYVDTYPGKPGEDDSNRTLAHEMQHLMNFVTSIQTRVNREKMMVYLMDTWIDEGLSSAAEYVYLGTHPEDRYGWFNDDKKGTIARGNNFFIWGNYEDDSILDDYATVYLFFQWLRLQSGGRGIYKDIINAPYPYYDYQAVTRAIKPYLGLMTHDNDWSGLLKTWMAANYINAREGPYGYMNESKLSAVKARTAPEAAAMLQLLPGEGVYSGIAAGGDVSSYAPGSGPNIKYACLSGAGTGSAVSDTEAHAGGVLLTYNANTDPEGKAERGNLAGPAANAGTARSGGGASPARRVGNTAREGPVRIDARDMLARNGRPREGFGRALLPGARAFAGEDHGK
jgi:hypothetical protein